MDSDTTTLSSDSSPYPLPSSASRSSDVIVMSSNLSSSTDESYGSISEIVEPVVCRDDELTKAQATAVKEENATNEVTTERSASLDQETKIQLLLPSILYLSDKQDENQESNQEESKQHKNYSTTGQIYSEYLKLPCSIFDTKKLKDYIYSHPHLQAHARYLISTKPIVPLQSLLINKDQYNRVYSSPLVYVHQHEIGHATTEQYRVNDRHSNLILASDAATTCHIIAVRTVMTTNNSNNDAFAVSSLVHLDTCENENCLKKMFALHGNTARKKQQQDWKQYQQSINVNKSDSNQRMNYVDCVNDGSIGKCVMNIHIIGGYNDSKGTSLEITNHVFKILDEVSTEYEDCLIVRLETCITTGLNDVRSNATTLTTSVTTEHNVEGPILRGLALNVSIGSIHFISSVCESLRGPESILRRVRSSVCHDMLTIHHAHEEGVCIPPFEYYSFPNIDYYLSLNDEKLLKTCSTSPECEDEFFCGLVREQYRYMRDVHMMSVFGMRMDCPVIYELLQVNDMADLTSKYASSRSSSNNTRSKRNGKHWSWERKDV